MNGMRFIDSVISGLHFVVRTVLNPADDIQMTAVNFEVTELLKALRILNSMILMTIRLMMI